jgi:hypothetical protein
LFQNSGIWPVSFKAVKKKLKEYGKKSKKDTGLAFLEYGSKSESESKAETEARHKPEPLINLQLIEDYQLPLLKPPSLYDKCVYAL